MHSMIDTAKQTVIDRAYRDLYLQIAAADLAESIQNVEELRLKARYDADNLGDVSGLKVLEVGPGQGHLARELERRGAHVSACDLIPAYLQALESDLSGRVFLADVQNMPINAEYDLVILCDVLEHVFRPPDALVSAYNALTPGGRIYVRSPSFERLTRYSRAAGCPWELVHLRTYTRSILKSEVLGVGFRRVKGPRLLRGCARTPRNTMLTPPAFWTGQIASYRDQYAGRHDLREVALPAKIRNLLLFGTTPERHRAIGLVTRPLSRAFSRGLELWILAEKPAA